MVDSSDEPPLSTKLHSWAKKKTPTSFNPFRSGRKDPDSSDNNVLPQHVRGNGESVIATSSSEKPSLGQDTPQQDRSSVDKKGDGAPPTTMTDNEPKASLWSRFIRDVKSIIFASWINWLLVFVPVGIILGAIVNWGGQKVVSPSVIFAINAVAIIPLASLLAFATESVASKMGDTIGALLNVTFGNAVELIIFIIALVAGEIRIVQASLLGSILSNLLLILGMCFVAGGLRFREQLYNSTSSQMSACLLSLSVVSLLLPTAFHASFSNTNAADRAVLKVSRGTSVILLLVYIIYLLFQLKSHAFMYESTPQHIIDEESHPGILAEFLNSSSSSDNSSSSDSDSDSSSNSHKASKRFRRALRRRRRKSTSSKDMSSAPSISRTPSSGTNPSSFLQPQAHTESPAPISPMANHDREVSFGGEYFGVDGEPHRSPAKRSPTVLSHDFQGDADTEARSKSKSKKKMKKEKRSKHSKKGRALPEIENNQNVKIPRASQVGFAKNVQAIGSDGISKQPLQAASQDTASRPALAKGFSSRFPHHEATGRSYPLPMRAPSAPQKSNSKGVRRTSSMPEMLQRTASSSGGAPTAQPLTHAVPNRAMSEAEMKEAIEPKKHLSRTSAVVLLLVTTGLVAICADFLVDSIDFLVSSTGVSQAFIGLIVLPIIGNAAEHVTAVTVAAKNKMDLAINVALGSSIQIALFVTPLIVILGWILNTEMSLYFSLFETVSLFASAFIVNYLMIDGRSNYLEGCLLMAAYIIIAVAAFFYPSCGLSAVSGQNDAGGGTC